MTSVASILDEYGIAISPAHRYPDVGQTRAVGTLQRIARRHGEGHLRLVLSTLCETDNNKACLDEYALYSVSDLIRACPQIVEHRMTEWLQCFDDAPVGELQFLVSDLTGVVPQRHALSGVLYERIARRFGPLSLQPDLFDDRRASR